MVSHIYIIGVESFPSPMCSVYNNAADASATAAAGAVARPV